MTIWRSIDVSLVSDASAAELAADMVRFVAVRLGLTDLAQREVELAIVEAVNNAVEHANGFDAGKSMRLVIEPSSTNLVLRVVDRGRPMSVGALAQAPSTMEHVETCALEALPQRGMGLSIMKMAMDDVSYQTTDGRNVLTLTKHVKRTTQMTRQG